MLATAASAGEPRVPHPQPTKTHWAGLGCRACPAGWDRGHVRPTLRTDVTNAPRLPLRRSGAFVVGGAQDNKGRRAPPRHGRYVIWLQDLSMLHRRVLWPRAARRRQGLTGGQGRSDGAA